MNRIITILIMHVVLLGTAFAQKAPIDLLKQNSKFDKIGRVIVKGNTIDIISLNFSRSGVAFRGDYNLDGYNRLEFTVTNKDAKYPLQLIAAIKNSDTTFREPVKGIHNRKYTIQPGERRKIVFDFIPALPHPEVAGDFRLMRNNPYSLLTKSYCYDVDLNSITMVEITSSRGTRKGQRWSLESPQILTGKLKPLPEPMTRGKEDFFPFIDQYGQFKYLDWKNKIHKDTDFKAAIETEHKDLAAHPGAKDWSKYGGYKKGPKLKATGHFRIQKVDGKWWMVDPEGYLFWSNGVVRVTSSSAVTPLQGESLENRRHYFEDMPTEGTPFAQFYRTHDALLKPYYTARGIDSTYDFSSANCYRKYGKHYNQIFAEMAHRRLKSWGLNTIANSSDKDICLMDKTPYIDRFEVVSRPLEGTSGWWPFMDPYDDSFNASLKAQFESRQREVQDPWCLGLFVDNEIKWNGVTYLAEMTLKAPKDQPCKIAMTEWLKKQYTTIEALNTAWNTYYTSWDEMLYDRVGVKAVGKTAEDLRQFNRQIIQKYFTNIREAFDTYAPGVLYMGCRFAGTANQDVIGIASKYCDVISYNSYQYNLSEFHAKDMDKPIMIGEYHFGAMDRGMFHASLIDAGSQEQRGKMMKNYITSALSNPNIIGVHWHQFADQATTGRFDGENFQVGLTDCCDTPYYETISMLRAVGYQIYPLRYHGTEK